MNFIKKMFSLIFNKETILYVVFGVLTTLVNLVVFKFCDVVLGDELYLLSNTIAWIISVLFAYITNKIFVFEKNEWSISIIKKEVFSFVSSRIVTYFVEQIGLWFFVEILNFDDTIFNFVIIDLNGKIVAKLILGVLVVLLNYVFSKFLIFKNNKN